VTEIIKIPQFDVNSETAKVLEIRVKVGDKVEIGDAIVTFETAKAAFDLESPKSGYVRKIMIEAGAEYEAQAFAFLFTDTLEENVELPAQQEVIKDSGNERPRLTAKARYLAKRREAAQSKDFVPKFTSETIKVPHKKKSLTNFQKGMGANLQFAKHEANSAFLEKFIDTTAFHKFIEQTKKEKGTLFDPTFAVIAWFYVQALTQDPSLNATIVNNEILEYSELNLGFTVESKGDLYIVTLKNADKLKPHEFIDSIFSLQRRALKKKLENEDLSGATVGITSLSSFGVHRHQPILPPFTSIMLALSEPFPQMGEKVYSAFGITYDHRLHTGVKMAGILNRLSKDLQDPGQIWI